MRLLYLLPATLGLVAAPSFAAPGGKPLPEVNLEGFTQTEAESLDDFFGRAVVFEFFAYW